MGLTVGVSRHRYVDGPVLFAVAASAIFLTACSPRHGRYRRGETVGTVNGAQRGQRLANDLIGEITLGSGETGVGYDFAEGFVAS